MKNTIKVIFKAIRDHFNWVSTLIISVFWVVSSFIYSFCIKDFNVFASSGAVMAIAGIYLSFWHTINLKPKNETELMAHKLAIMRFAPTPGTDEYKNMLKEAQRTLINERVGFIMSIIGTFIWAYGGYINI